MPAMPRTFHRREALLIAAFLALGAFALLNFVASRQNTKSLLSRSTSSVSKEFLREEENDGSYNEDTDRHEIHAAATITQHPLFFFGIPSGTSPSDYKLRMAWRQSHCPAHYAQHGMRYKFMVGRPYEKGHDLTRHNQAGIDTEQERRETLSLLVEQDVYQDLVATPTRDQALALSDKLVLTLEYIYTYFPNMAYIGIHDVTRCMHWDGIATVLDTFDDWWHNPQDHPETYHDYLYAGHLLRNSKESVTIRGLDAQDHDFMDGQGYFLSRSLVGLLIHEDRTFTVLNGIYGNTKEAAVNVGKWVYYSSKRHNVSTKLLEEPTLLTRVEPEAHNPSPASLEQTPTMVFGIKSGTSAKEQERRMMWRNSTCPRMYANLGIGYVFVVGRPYEANHDLTASGRFFWDTPAERADAQRLLEESQEYNDIVAFPMRDQYMALPDKVLQSFEYLYHHYPNVSFIGSHDVEYCVDMSIVKEVVNDFYNVFHATYDYLWAGAHQWNGHEYEQMKVAEKISRPYFSGMGYMLSRPLVRLLIQDDRFHSIMHGAYGGVADDVDMGKWVQYACERHNVTVKMIDRRGFMRELGRML